MQSGGMIVSFVMLMWYRPCGDTASGVVEAVEGGPDI